MIEVPASDGHPLSVHRVDPDGARPHPSVCVFPSIFGVTDELCGHADAFAAAGARVFVFDPFCRTPVPGPMGPSENREAIDRLQHFDRERAAADFRDLVAALRAEPSSNGAVIGLGICLGGPFVWHAAADGLLDGAATWHGSRMGKHSQRAGDIACPLQMDFGGADPVVPLDEVELIRAALGDRDDVDIRVHAGASHGFSHTGWPSFHEVAHDAGRRGVLELIARATTAA